MPNNNRIKQVYLLVHTYCYDNDSLSREDLFPKTEPVRVYESLDDAREAIGDELNLMFQYGLGDGFREIGENESICADSTEDIVQDGGHNPHITFTGNEVTVGYCENPEEVGEQGPFRRYTITPLSFFPKIL